MVNNRRTQLLVLGGRIPGGWELLREGEPDTVDGGVLPVSSEPPVPDAGRVPARVGAATFPRDRAGAFRCRKRGCMPRADPTRSGRERCWAGPPRSSG